MTRNKSESSLKKKIKEMKKTSKGNAILKLIGWAIFFFALLIFCGISSIITKNMSKPTESIKDTPINKPIENPTKPTNTKNIKDYLLKLSTGDYSYSFEITSHDVKYIFKGTKENNIDTGYKETASGIIKYSIENGSTYQELVDSKVLITNLYENLEPKILNISTLIEILNNLTFEKNESVFKSKDIINDYLITVNENNIENILITSVDYEYNLNFDIKEVKE